MGRHLSPSWYRLGLILTGLGLPVAVVSLANGWRASWVLLAVATLVVVPFAWLYLRLPPSHSALAVEGRKSVSASPPIQAVAVTEYAGLYALFGLSYVIYVTFFAEMLRNLGLPLFQVGLVWALVGALSLASGPLAGALSDRVGRRGGLAVLFGLQTVSYLALLNGSGSALVVSVVLFGATAWGIPAIMAAAMSDVGRTEDAMAAFGRVTAVMGVGQAVGPFLAGTLVDATGVVDSGLWISTLAAGCAVAWIVVKSLARRPASVGG